MTVVPFTQMDAGTRARLIALARAAICIDDDDWGTEDQIAAHNAFCECAERQMTAVQRTAWEDYAHKAESDEIVHEALRVLGLSL
jgi:hypothetical protein